MRIQKIDPEKFAEAFGITCRRLYPMDGLPTTPFNAYWNIIPPESETKLHRHHEGETFIIVRGAGVITVAGESREVEVGDAIYMDPFAYHTLANTSESEELLFLNIYWEDMKLIFDPSGSEASTAAQPAATAKPAATAAPRKRTVIYGSPPNPNGDMHLGHMSGPYLTADILVRHRRMLGEDAHLAIGTDDNQCWTAAKASQLGLEPQETADRFATEITKTLDSARLNVSAFYRPNAGERYSELVCDAVEKLYAQGHLVAREAPALVCEGCSQYLFEVYVSGKCPHCGVKCCGNACEDCGRPNEVVDLVDPVCAGCGATPKKTRLRRLFFPLEPHRQTLLDYYDTVVMSTRQRALCRQLMEGPMPEIIASHLSGWGIPVPLQGFDGQCVSAWIEMAPGYLAGSADVSDAIGRDDGWRAFYGSDHGQSIQCYGYDNCWNHGLVYPALLKAYDPEIRLPIAHITNEFYLLDHEKFSTSRGHAVWARDLIGKNSADTVRFYMARTRPEAERTNFSLGEFSDFVERELIGRWGGWLAALQAKVSRGYDGAVPEAGAWSDNHRSYLERLQQTLVDIGRAYALESFSLQRITRLASELVRAARDFGKTEDAWAAVGSAKDERRTGIALELAAARALALTTAPVMPDFAQRLWEGLGYSDQVGDQSWQTLPEFVAPGNQVRGLDADFFPRPVISDEAAGEPPADGESRVSEEAVLV